MAKKIADVHQNVSMNVCVEKFHAYAEPRKIILKPATYGFYEVRSGNTKRILGAVKAVKADGTTGWVINFADKERKFIADTDHNVVVGKKKYTPEECAKYRRDKRKKLLVPYEEE